MTTNTIVALYGRSSEGKSKTIRKLITLIQKNFTDLEFILRDKNLDKEDGDVTIIIKIGVAIIGIISEGDPDSQTILNKTLEKLSKSCNFIFCTSRTKGNTVHIIDNIAFNTSKFNTIWISSFFSPSLNTDILNDECALALYRILNKLMEEKI